MRRCNTSDCPGRNGGDACLRCSDFVSVKVTEPKKATVFLLFKNNGCEGNHFVEVFTSKEAATETVINFAKNRAERDLSCAQEWLASLEEGSEYISIAERQIEDAERLLGAIWVGEFEIQHEDYFIVEAVPVDKLIRLDEYGQVIND